MVVNAQPARASVKISGKSPAAPAGTSQTFAP